MTVGVGAPSLRGFHLLQQFGGVLAGTRMTYPGVLDFPNEDGAQPPMYVCVAENTGA
ncbi:hypothetical protein [Streptomyces chartreusis]|uniref:hypothetical protein n=1 Tax=Streptomyces chartreusis TaxID=1969 RepID=UPI00364CD1D5